MKTSSDENQLTSFDSPPNTLKRSVGISALAGIQFSDHVLKRVAFCCILMMIALVAHSSAGASADQEGLLLRCDVECIIAVDGKVTSLLEPDKESLFPLSAGKHTLCSIWLATKRRLSGRGSPDTLHGSKRLAKTKCPSSVVS
jgi:hypothetical protein